MVRSFLLRLAALLAPFAIVLAFPFAVMWRAGEFMPLDEVARLQARDAGSIYGPAYSNSWRYLKRVAFTVRRPTVAAIGTSRVMQLRAAGFRHPESFYNAGGAVYEPEDFNRFLDSLDRAAQPRILLVGLDQNFFNERWQYPPELLSSFEGNRFLVEAKAFQRNWKLVYSDVFHHKISLRALSQYGHDRQRVGLGAMMDRGAFRHDGSFYYMREIGAALRGEAPPHVRFAPQLAAIDAGREQFTWGATVSPASIASLQSFLDACQARGIHVVGFLPPFAHEVYARMHGSPHYRYLDRIEPTIKPLFTARGFTFVDCSDLAALGGTDDETIDGFHGSEMAYVRVLLRLASEDKMLREQVDVDRLQRALPWAKNPFEVF